MATDLSKDDAAELVRLHRENETLEAKIADDMTAIKANRKKIDAMLSRVAKVMHKADRRTKNRYGISFRLVDRQGRIAWRRIVETLKGHEYAERIAAEAPITQKVEYTIAKGEPD